ncbi:alpha/beta hydrolase-fold protein, partial [Rhizobium leguminosarum]|uniref:alpha/beta hydrolase-fold protein n=1 Tax=Rhizobium leguminosarum TaxID=384 RepID=UPI003F986A15
MGQIDKIQSIELSETRILNIYLPDGYSPDSSTTYPVIYLLDGSANEDFIHIVGIVQFLNMIES